MSLTTYLESVVRSVVNDISEYTAREKGYEIDTDEIMEYLQKPKSNDKGKKLCCIMKVDKNGNSTKCNRAAAIGLPSCRTCLSDKKNIDQFKTLGIDPEEYKKGLPKKDINLNNKSLNKNKLEIEIDEDKNELNHYKGMPDVFIDNNTKYIIDKKSIVFAKENSEGELIKLSNEDKTKAVNNGFILPAQNEEKKMIELLNKRIEKNKKDISDEDTDDDEDISLISSEDDEDDNGSDLEDFIAKSEESDSNESFTLDDKDSSSDDIDLISCSSSLDLSDVDDLLSEELTDEPSKSRSRGRSVSVSQSSIKNGDNHRSSNDDSSEYISEYHSKDESN